MKIKLEDITIRGILGFETLRAGIWYNPRMRRLLGQNHQRLEELIIGCRVLHRTEIRNAVHEQQM